MKFNTLRIVGKLYSIKIADIPDRGACEAVQQKISIQDGLPPDEERDAAIHEVLHAVEDAFGLDMPDRHVRCLATGFYAVLRDNPEFFKYLGERIGKP